MKRKAFKKEKRFRSKKEQFLTSFTERTQIPEEILLGACSIAVTGQKELIVENYKSILEYQPERLVLLTKQCRVEISGKHLSIRYYAQETMRVTGTIESITYRK